MWRQLGYLAGCARRDIIVTSDTEDAILTAWPDRKRDPRPPSAQAKPISFRRNLSIRNDQIGTDGFWKSNYGEFVLLGDRRIEG